jgi:hypothetical protein
MTFNSQLIGHRATWTKEGGFHSKEVSGHLFEGIYGRIFAKNIVSHWRARHGGQHFGARFCYSIGPKVYHGCEDKIPNRNKIDILCGFCRAILYLRTLYKLI